MLEEKGIPYKTRLKGRQGLPGLLNLHTSSWSPQPRFSTAKSHIAHEQELISRQHNVGRGEEADPSRSQSSLRLVGTSTVSFAKRHNRNSQKYLFNPTHSPSISTAKSLLGITERG